MNEQQSESTLAILAVVTAAGALALVYLLIRKIFRSMQEPVEPIKGIITSHFGKRPAPIAGASTIHNGVDISAHEGTRVVSPWDGVCYDVYNDTKYGGGKTMLIRHNNGYRTGYCHLSRYLVKKGDTVKRGQAICLTGNTGHSTGPHLHFTLTDPSQAKINPETMFKFA